MKIDPRRSNASRAKLSVLHLCSINSLVPFRPTFPSYFILLCTLPSRETLRFEESREKAIVEISIRRLSGYEANREDVPSPVIDPGYAVS